MLILTLSRDKIFSNEFGYGGRKSMYCTAKNFGFQNSLCKCFHFPISTFISDIYFVDNNILF